MLRCLLLLFLVPSSFEVSEIYFRNFCDKPLDIIKTTQFDEPKLLVTVPVNQKRLTVFESGRMNFRCGWNKKTLAEFRLNEDQMDYYFINVIAGYDSPLTIAPYDGYAINCTSANCPDGVLFPHELDGRKVHAMPASSEFNVVFCPQHIPFR